MPEHFNITYKSYPDTKNSFNVSHSFDDDVFANRLVDGYSPYRYGSYYIVEANNKTKRFSSAVFVNTTSQDVAAAYPEFLYEAILKKALGRPNFKLRLTTTPYPITEKLR